MKRTLSSLSLKAGLASLALLAACSPGTTPPNTVGTPGDGGTASISGSVVKADSSPARNATMVLIQQSGGADHDVQIVRTDDNGQYRFTNIAAGQYRLAFVLQTEDERRNHSTEPKYYNPSGDPQTAQYFSFITTGNFDYSGTSGASYQVPQMNVGWVSNLSPHATTVSSNGPINFTWSAVPGATDYSLDIRDANNNPFYKSSFVTTNNFSWSDLKGNQGANNGKPLTAGKYFYIVNARLNRTNMGDGPTPNYGGTALATFNVN